MPAPMPQGMPIRWFGANAFRAEDFFLHKLKDHEGDGEHADGDVQFARGKFPDELHAYDHADDHAGQEILEILFLPLAPVVPE